MTEMLFGDTLSNLLTGLGTQKDRSEGGRFSNRYLSPAEINAMYDGDWIASTIIDAPCDDMTREWREWKAGPRQTAAIEAEERRLGLQHKMNRALKLARKDGGSAILIGTGDTKPEEPLDVAKISKGGIKYLHVLSRYEVTPGALDRDPQSEHFGGPKNYMLSSGPSGSVTVHPSRVIRFLGIAPLDLSSSAQGWGASVLERVYEAVRNAAAVCGNLAGLTHEAKVDVFKIKDLTRNILNADYREKVLARFALANTAKSLNYALILDAEEEWNQKTVSFSTFPELIRQYIEIAAGAGGMPITRLLGTTPGGLSNNNDGSLRHWYDTLSSKQEVEIRPTLTPLDAVLIRSALGSNPDGIWYEFKPLWQLTEAELSEVALRKAEATQIYGQLGVMPKEALRESARSQISEDGIYPGFDGIMEKHANEASEPLIEPRTRGKDPTRLLGAANSNEARAPLALVANDASPRSLYLSRKVENASDIIAWAKKQGFKTTVAANDLHVTIAYSRAAVDWFDIGTDDEKIVVPRAGPRAVEVFDGGAAAILFACWSLAWRHERVMDEGGSWDHANYQPHVTFSFDAGDVDLSKVEPYQGRIVLGPEIFAEIQEDVKPKLS